MAEETQYKVSADLVLDATKAQQQAVQMRSKIHDLGRRISGTSSLAGGLTRNLVAMGGAYLGISALARAFASLTRGAVTYGRELEKTQIGLTAVLAAVSGEEWETAQRTAGRVFEQVRQDSIKSVATAQQLFNIYQGIVGPILSAGKGLAVVRTLTRDTVNAAGALNVDLPQAQRDVSMMVRGTAGMEVKLFSMLRSTGAIAETTEEWNKSLTAAERVDKLRAALGKYAQAGDKFAKSFAGTTSTFKGIRQEFTRSAFQPVMDAMASSLFRINDIMVKNQVQVQARLKQWGESTAKRLERVFKGAEKGVDMLVNRWDEVLARIERVGKIMKTAGKIAAVGIGVQLARPAVGAVVGGVGTMAGMFAANTAAAAAAGAGAGGAGAAAAGAGGAGAGAAVAGLAPALAIAAVAAAALGGAVLVVREQWGAFQAMFTTFGPIVAGLWEGVQGLAKTMWEALAPVLKVVGHVLGAVLVPVFAVVVGAVRLLVHYMGKYFDAIKPVTNAIYNFLLPVFDALWGAIDRFVSLVTTAVTSITDDVARINALPTVAEGGDVLKELAARFPERGIPTFSKTAQTPTARVTTVNDFRGSKIVVKQEFKDMDPDRVLIAMQQGLARQAEMRIQSGMLPALGR